MGIPKLGFDPDVVVVDGLDDPDPATAERIDGAESIAPAVVAGYDPVSDFSYHGSASGRL